MSIMAGSLVCVALALCLPASVDDQSPVEVSADSFTDVTLQGSWGLSIDRRGRGRLQAVGEPERALFVDEMRLRRLRDIVRKERFFELGRQYGDTCIDCPYCTLSVKLGDQHHAVTISLLHDEPLTPAGASQMARAVRVWEAVKEAAGVATLPDACHPSKGIKAR
jgi:hypothetical protein